MSNTHKPTWHASLPWDSLRRRFLTFRRRRFQAPPREGPYLVVDVGPDRVRRVLGAQGYAPQWTLSYDKGEDCNLARIVHSPSGHEVPRATWGNALRRLTGGDLATEFVEWWQTHVRGYELDGGGVALTAHWEPSAMHEDSAHLDGVGFETGIAMDAVGEVLADADIVPRTVDERPFEV